MHNGNIFQKSTRFGIGLIVLFTFFLAGCGGGGGGSGGGVSGDWYYHWNCNGDSSCLSTNPGAANQASGTLDEGPSYSACSPLLTFAQHFWNMPPATDSCDQSSATPIPILSLRSIIVTPANKVLPLGATQQYTATATYSNGTSADVTAKATWQAGTGLKVIGGPPPVATISSGGLATTSAVGSIAITATQGVISGSTALYVNAATLQSITVTPASPNVLVGVAEHFVATGTYSDGTTQDISSSVTWTSGTPAVATMTTNTTVCGQVCVVYPDSAAGVSPGTSAITATSGAISGSTTLTVVPATLVSISISPTNPTVARNFTRQLTAIGQYNNGTITDITSQVTWLSGTPSIATIDTVGVVTGITAGSSTITATLGSISGSATLSVNSTTLLSISTITPTKPSCIPNAIIQLSATGNFSDGSSYILPAGLTWSSNTPSIATVYSSGIATCVAIGTSTITAASGTVSGSIVLTVRATPRYAYVANLSAATGSAVSQYTVGIGGELTAMNPPTVATGLGARFVIVDPSGQFVYVVGGGTGVWQYTIGAGGALTPMATPTVTTGGYGPFFTAVDPTGRYVYVVNGGSGLSSTFISQYTIGIGGALTPMTPPTITTAVNTGSIAIDPSGQFVYVTQGTNSVLQYTISAGGTLSPMSPASVTAGTGPSSVIVDPSGQYVYVANSTSNTVSQYTIGAGGALSPMSPATVATGSAPNSVTVDPSGQYVYVANAGGNTISQYTIGVGGALTLMTPATVATGSGPLYVTVDPSGQYVYVANYIANNVSQYVIGAGGALTPMAAATIAAGTEPYSVVTTK